MDKSSPAPATGKPAKPVVRGKGKGKALNAIAAASGRDPAAIVKSVTEAAAALEAEEAAKKAAEIARAKAREAAKKREEASATQIYASLAPEERYRFECFRRCGFASKPIEKFVAKTLVNEAERRYLARRGAVVGLGCQMSGGAGGAPAVTDTSDADSSAKKTNSSRKRKQSKRQMLKEESKRRRAAMDQPLHSFWGGGGNGNGGDTPPLDNLVVPNSSSEIVAVVSTLAKRYGQRLVAAAKRVAEAEAEAEEEDNGANTTKKPLLPHHFMEAHRHRVRAGVDPGFWMADRIEARTNGSMSNAGGVGAVEAAALGTVDRGRACHLAALAAQDAYDKVAEEEKGNDLGDDSKMEVEDSTDAEKPGDGAGAKDDNPSS